MIGNAHHTSRPSYSVSCDVINAWAYAPEPIKGSDSSHSVPFSRRASTALDAPATTCAFLLPSRERDDLPAAFSRKRRPSHCLLAEEPTLPPAIVELTSFPLLPFGRNDLPDSPSWNRHIFHQSSWSWRPSHQPSWNRCAFAQLYSTANHKLYCVHPTNESSSACYLFSSRSIIVKYFFVRVSCVCKELLSYISTTVCIKGSLLSLKCYIIIVIIII